MAKPKPQKVLKAAALPSPNDVAKQNDPLPPKVPWNKGTEEDLDKVDKKVEELVGYPPWTHSAKTPFTQLAYADSGRSSAKRLEF